MAWLTKTEIEALGFAKVGTNVLLSNKTSYYNCSRIEIGDNVRIDDFCVLSAGVGGIIIGSNVHIAVYSSLIGAGKIKLSDFSGLSSRVSIYSSNDDYSGSAMTNPTIPENFTNVTHADVLLERHVIVGAGSIILPGVILEEGVAIGALSLVNKNCQAFTIYAGSPLKRITSRKRDLLEIEKAFLNSQDTCEY
ncbi:galactoside O-acetyltransferase [Picosynechococcus sp. PCC 7003]|uniref:acyltransferase n=1 Tax=Picosynechococcus sp. PCC 7003 TaxID=374981 RepID=UPI000810D5AF|nr:acyltransferase [Picosynechococcus sp. PCC 7003]ANV83288.1 galactoside O-acetyltransferase [Picosynechococcus sp. PCC 7003]